MQADPWPRLIVDQALSIQWINPQAREQLADCGCLSFAKGQLTATDPDHARLIRGLVTNCREGQATLSLRCDDNHIVIRARPIRIGNEAFIGMRIHRTGDHFPHGYANLETAFGLTRSEVNVMRHLARGLNADLVAREMSISLETTRSHIRNIYRKVGASCRESLFYRLRPFLEM